MGIEDSEVKDCWKNLKKEKQKKEIVFTFQINKKEYPMTAEEIEILKGQIRTYESIPEENI